MERSLPLKPAKPKPMYSQSCLAQNRLFYWISLQNNLSFGSNFLNKRNLQCGNSIENVEYKGVVSDTEEDKPKAEIRRKNLAVFVSGGGSNFRPIYEATLNGSVHGDIVALVTNKHDCGGAEYAPDEGIPVIAFPQRKDAEE